MSLKIKTPTSKLIWFLGDDRYLLTAFLRSEIFSVTAQGKELEYIREHFTNLPMLPRWEIVVWHGEMARFIIANFFISHSTEKGVAETEK